MEFQVLDVDYVLVNERPVIRIFGKTAEGQTVCCFQEGFLPYFYADGKDVEKMLEGDPKVFSLQTVKKCLTGGYQQPRDVFKITLKNPQDTVDMRERLNKHGIKTYEADILFKYRWMSDNGVGGLGWIKTNECNGISTSSVRADRKISGSDIRPLEKNEDAPLKYLAFDIETATNEENKMPDSKRDPVIMISFVFEPHYNGKKSIVLCTRPGNGAEHCDSEKDMLKRIVDVINDYDPDIITGYNINNFDIPYILERMNQNKIAPFFGRCESKRVTATKFAVRHRINITGRIIVDSFEIVKKDWSLKRYGLDLVAQELLKEKKIGVKKSEISKLWKGSMEDVNRLVDYCRRDSVLAINLVLKLNLLDKYKALSKISGSLLQDILNAGESQRIENYLLREFDKEGFILPCRPDGSFDEEENEELKGGFVLEPKRGLHDFIIVLDFKSMYPSLIRTYNICPTTLVKGKTGLESTEVMPETSFVSKSVRVGIVPKILERLMDERQAVKRVSKHAPSELKRSLHMKQLAIKIMANAFYGYFGYRRSKLYNLDIANSVTYLGRSTIQKTVETIRKTFDYETVYGDTDSVMVKVNTKDLDEAEVIGKNMSEELTKQLPGIMELDFEKIYKRFLPLTKKRYMAWSFEKDKNGEWRDSMVMKGIETVRRDWCELTSETMLRVIEIILKENDVKAAVKYFKGVVNDLLGDKIDISKLMITKTITKRPEAYVGIQPHVEVMKKMKKRNDVEMPGVGDRIGYVIVKGTQILSKRAEDPAYVKEMGIKIDPQYYIDNQLLPPLQRIFDALGVDRHELVGGGKQMGLMEIINNHRKMADEQAAQTPVIEIAGAEEVTGFVCRECNRPYRRPPLAGQCECGGPLVFSTSAGPAEKVRVNGS